MKLFIIGNGFDIGHGLATQYWNFRTYLEKMYPEFLYAFEEHYYIYPKMSDARKAELLWNELETNLANINEDVIIENGVNMDMNLDSGDVGIEDTLYEYFSDEYSYIAYLAKYLKQWVRTIRIRDTKKKSSLITNDSLYITFNYTSVLENVYRISPSNITHIHGSLRKYDIDPVLGHGNHERIERILLKKEEAERLFDEKWISIFKAVEDYYKRTYKNTSCYISRISKFDDKAIDEICVIGHSLSGVDKNYFNRIDNLTKGRLIWKVYYYHPDEKEKLKNNLLDIGIDTERIKLIPSEEFYDL